MAKYNGNNAYVKINGVEVANPTDDNEQVFIQFDVSLSVGDENVTAGAGTEWEDHAGKLKVANGKLTIIYDTARVTADLAAIADTTQAKMVVPIEYGPEGNASGKPYHDQDFLVTKITGPSVHVEKNKVVFEMDCISAGTPRKNIYAGDTVA